MMWADWDSEPAPPDASPPAVGPVRPSSGAPGEDETAQPSPAGGGQPPARGSSFSKRLDRVLLVVGGLIAAGAIAVGTGLVSLPGDSGDTHNASASAKAALAAERATANRQWASAVCTNILAWKNELKHDESFDLGFGPLARVKDAIGATTRMVGRLDQLGLPPAAQTAQARAEAQQLRSEVEARVGQLESAANSVAGGNLGAIGTLVGDLNSDKALGPQFVDELRHLISVDLGLSLAETSACRQLVGIPI